MTTYATMDISDLGDNCNARDLAWFAIACERRQAQTGESDEQVTAWMWGQGDWDRRATLYADRPDAV